MIRVVLFGLVIAPVDYSCVCEALSGLSSVAWLRLVDNSRTWVLLSGARLEDAGARLRDDVTGVVSDVQRGGLHDGCAAAVGQARQ